MRRLSILVSTPAARMLGYAACVCAFFGPATPGSAQKVQLTDLVITLAGSVEGYSGNLASVTAPVVDSTNQVSSAVGELGVRGALSLFQANTRSLDVLFDGGLRQAAAMGFESRDYAPQEWAGSASARFGQNLGGWGSLRAMAGVRGRWVRNRPPMPLFLQPGYVTTQWSLGLATRSFDGVSFDLTGNLESGDYRAPSFSRELDLLDRSVSGLELGLRWGGAAQVRFYSGLRWVEYANQETFDPDDPFRRDRTVRVGIDWTFAGTLIAQVGLDGALNRSNSNRPEYDALSLRGSLTAPLPGALTLNVFTVLTAKSYVHDTDFARLVPGEEADNASIAFVQLGRALASNLDGALRLSWTRAETDIGRAYYERVGASVQFNYRPTAH